MKRTLLLTLPLAGAALAVTLSPIININALEGYQRRFETQLLAQTPGQFPFEVLSASPGIHVQGVGLTLSSVVSLSYLEPAGPFRQPYTPKELATFRDRKLERVPILERTMREVMADTANASEIDPLPPNERVILGVTLFYFKWENSDGLPRQIVMSAEKQQLLKARREKLDLATIVQEQKL